MSKRGGRKRPNREVDFNRKKSPRTASIVRPSFQNERIRWSFSMLDMEGPFGWSAFSIQGLEEVLKPKLTNFETMTWGEIEGRQNHAIPREQLSREAERRLVEINLDIEEVFSLRIRGKERVIGVRDKDVFMFLWWDPEHKVCPSKFGK